MQDACSRVEGSSALTGALSLLGVDHVFSPKRVAGLTTVDLNSALRVSQPTLHWYARVAGAHSRDALN